MKDIELQQGSETSDSGDDSQPILSKSHDEGTILKKTHRLIVLGILLLVALPLLISTIVLAVKDDSASDAKAEGMV
jgi:hypothetical protein